MEELDASARQEPLYSPLPMSREEMEARGWDALDVLLVSGDAYVDHPAFGVALLGRWLEAHGFSVGIVAQPRWDSADDVLRMGRPRLFVGVTAGALDSMLAHYTAFRKKRRDDAYTPGGVAGARPNRACIVYTGLVRQAFPGLPVVIGGIEASLRRATHYDFWQDKLRRSILLDSKADLLVYGMAERAVLDIATRLRNRAPDKPYEPQSLYGISGTAFAAGHSFPPPDPTVIELPSHEAILADAFLLMKATLALEQQVHDGTAWAVQASGDRKVCFTPPAAPLTTEELDTVYALPFSRRAHPSYEKPVPAAAMIQFSVTTHRGCGGGCSFCSLALHQGRRIASRSATSVLAETQELARHPDWAGGLTDVGGPSANLWGARCTLEDRKCRRPSCLTPKRCPHLETKQPELASLLEAIEAVPGVDHVRVASGIRHDVAIGDEPYVQRLVERFVGGQLKLAPEHLCDHILRLMRKPPFSMFEGFLTLFERRSRGAGKEQYIVPYLMSAFPGCTDDDMRTLAQWFKQRGWTPRQVQCFIPTPGTVATAMFYSGRDPEGNPIHVARTDAKRLRQHRLLVPQRPGGGGRGPRKHTRQGRPKRV